VQKLGINIDALEDFALAPLKLPNYENTVKMIADLGFGAVFSDISFGAKPEKIAELCSRYALEYQFVHTVYKGINNMWLDNIDGRQMFETLLSNIDSCSRANVPIAVVHISSGFTPPPITQLGIDRFTALVEHAQNKNVKIAFENLRVPKYLKWAMDNFKENDFVGFCWDIGHENCFTRGIEYMSLYGDRLLCTHIHDNYKKLGGDLHLIPFDGKIDYKKAALHLKKSGYNGHLMLEVFSKNEIYKDVTDIEFLTKAYNAIKKFQKLILD